MLFDGQAYFVIKSIVLFVKTNDIKSSLENKIPHLCHGDKGNLDNALRKIIKK